MRAHGATVEARQEDVSAAGKYRPFLTPADATAAIGEWTMASRIRDNAGNWKTHCKRELRESRISICPYDIRCLMLCEIYEVVTQANKKRTEHFQQRPSLVEATSPSEMK